MQPYGNTSPPVVNISLRARLRQGQSLFRRRLSSIAVLKPVLIRVEKLKQWGSVIIMGLFTVD